MTDRLNAREALGLLIEGDTKASEWYGTDTLSEYVRDEPYAETESHAWEHFGYAYQPAKVVNGVEIECVEDFGGEGQGEQRYVVFSFVSNDTPVQYFRKDGYYASYDGSTWDGDWREVTATQKTITVYE